MLLYRLDGKRNKDKIVVLGVGDNNRFYDQDIIGFANRHVLIGLSVFGIGKENKSR